jgi:hypothetical protein
MEPQVPSAGAQAYRADSGLRSKPRKAIAPGARKDDAARRSQGHAGAHPRLGSAWHLLMLTL